MLNNLWASIFTAGTAAKLPSAAPDNTSFPRLYFATDTYGMYEYDSTNAAWNLMFQLKPVTVATLPTTNLVAGTLAVVSDATTPSVGGAVTGGSTVQCAVIWNGSAWKVA